MDGPLRPKDLGVDWLLLKKHCVIYTAVLTSKVTITNAHLLNIFNYKDTRAYQLKHKATTEPQR